jgi:Spy/CpxP family protein refolding chaperone
MQFKKMHFKNNTLLNILFAASVSITPAIAADTGSDTSPVRAILAAAPIVIAQAGAAESFGEEHHKGHLTDEQLEKMVALKNQYLDSIGPKVTELKSLQRQLHSVFLKENVDRSQALAIESRISTIKADLATARLNHHIDMLDVLTPEQHERLRRHLLMASVFGGGCGHEGQKWHHKDEWKHGHEGRGHEGPEHPHFTGALPPGAVTSFESDESGPTLESVQVSVNPEPIEDPEPMDAE